MNKKTLVLGASLKEERYSNLAIKKLIGQGHEVIAIGLVKGVVHGVRIETGKPDFDRVDTVTMYLKPDSQKDYYNYIISLKPSRVIFNPGTENVKLFKILNENQIEKEIACTLTLLSINQY